MLKDMDCSALWSLMPAVGDVLFFFALIASETQDMLRKAIDVFKSCNVIADTYTVVLDKDFVSLRLSLSFSLKLQLGFVNSMQSSILA